MAATILVPGIALASHTFGDVTDGNPFHDDIAAFAGAGITSGFPDGGYHPSNPVSRQAMAAFLHRGLPRTATVPFSASVAPTSRSLLAEVDLSLDGTPAGAQGVLIRVEATASMPTEDACEWGLELVADDESIGSKALRAAVQGSVEQHVTLVVDTSQPTDGTVTYGLYAYDVCEQLIVDDGVMTVENYVFTGSGDPVEVGNA